MTDPRVDALMAACEVFIRDRGRHDGEHVTAAYSPCARCEQTYIEAEARFDTAVAAFREEWPSPLKTALERMYGWATDNPK
jgi:hypothetical protein